MDKTFEYKVPKREPVEEEITGFENINGEVWGTTADGAKYKLTCHSVDVMIEVPFEEYKELLMIKGKYEELKELYKPWYSNPNKITYHDFTHDGDKQMDPRKVTCNLD